MGFQIMSGAEQMDPNSVKSNWNEIADNFDDVNLKESLP